MDEDRQSRVIGTIGLDAMRAVAATRLLLVGVSGVGLEVAKNLVLMGPRSLTLCDPRPLPDDDADFNFYHELVQAGGARCRAAAVAPKLAELNADSRVAALELRSLQELLSEAAVEHFDVVLVCDLFCFSFVSELDALCRARGKKFIAAAGLGLLGFVFDDFGRRHRVLDPSGREPATALIESINGEGQVNFQKETPFAVAKGDLVRFSEVGGMEGLNGRELRVSELLSTSACLFEEIKLGGFGEYNGGGRVKQVVSPFDVEFLSLSEAAEARCFDETHSTSQWKEKLGEVKHFFVELWKRLECDAFFDCRPGFGELDCLEAARAAAGERAAAQLAGAQRARAQRFLGSETPRFVCGMAAAQLAPVSALIGGVAAHEAIKTTGKYTPLRQWFFYEAYSDFFPGGQFRAEAPAAGRYWGQRAVLGEAAQARMGGARVLMVGAGAIGCEMLKLLGQMGVCCGDGLLSVADDDRIELSNLSRQFLFGRADVGRNKSEVAVQLARRMSPALRAESFVARVDESSEALFSDRFWAGLDFSINAVDNVKARLYVDRRNNFFDKPTFDSGTEGAMLSTARVIPGQTEPYSGVEAPAETGPSCTEKSFPYLMSHCVSWGKSVLADLWLAPAKLFAEFCALPPGPARRLVAEFRANASKAAEMREAVRCYNRLLEDFTPLGFVRAARDVFFTHFEFSIRQLTENYPEDALDTEGRKYWSGVKRFPRAVRFDKANPDHLNFVRCAARLFDQLFRPANRFDFDAPAVARLLDGLEPEPSALSEDLAQSEGQRRVATDRAIEKLFAALDKIRNVVQIRELAFEKDDDSNGQIDFLFSFCNLRAAIYSIEPADRNKIKFMAGKIVPAISTATAAVAGLVGLELYKHFLGLPLGQLREAHCNLSLLFFQFNVPPEPDVLVDKAYNPQYGAASVVRPRDQTVWTKMPLQGPLTVRQIENEVKDAFDVDISFLMYETKIVWDAEDEDDLKIIDCTLEEVLQQKGVAVPPHKSFLRLSYTQKLVRENGDTVYVEAPPIKYAL